MKHVRLHVAGDGVVWVMSRCEVCGDVSKHLVADALRDVVPCPKCGRRMDIRGATIDAVGGANAAGPLSG